MNTDTKTKKTRAEWNAEQHARFVLELYRAYRILNADQNAPTVEVGGCMFSHPDEIRDRVTQQALSVEVRSDWHTPGDNENASPNEYRVLLTWGGPALMLCGDLDEHGSPEGNARFEIQDWGTPWTVYRPDVCFEDYYEKAVAWFANCFYFGEC